MPDFRNPKEISDFLSEIGEASLPQRRELAWNTGVARCYVEGLQWLTGRWAGQGFRKDATSGRMVTNFDPDSTALRVTDNITHTAVQKVAAHTRPDDFSMDVYPPDHDSSSEAFYIAQVHESLMNLGVEACNLVATAQVANFRRCVSGTHGIGVALQSGVRVIDGQPLPDQRMRTFQFDASNLILDPACQDMLLHEHEFVCYTDVWTADAIERTYGITLDREKLSTIEELEPVSQKLSVLSDSRLFSRFVRFSKTKGARVYQLHCKDATGCFGKWYVAIDTNEEEKKLLNPDDVSSPFGGCGMPFALLHGNWRTDSIWSWGEPAQMKDSQDQRNLAKSLFWRITQKHSGFQWIVDKRFFGTRPNKEDIAKELTNQVYGIVMGDLGNRGANVAPPQLVQHGNVPPFLMEVMQEFKLEAKEKIHTSEGLYGKVPTHVPTSNFQRAQDDAGQVLSARVHGDLQAYRHIVGVMHGTNVKLVQAKNPGTLAWLDKRGFEAQDFAVLLQSDPYDPPVQFKVREGSVRTRSYEAKKQALDTALQLQAISPQDYQAVLADELDSPLATETRQMIGEFRKAALRIIAGEQWVPLPLGEFNPLCIKEFTKAQFDRRARQDPAARQRLGIAIQSQQAAWAQEQVASNPELQAKLASGGETSNAEQAQQGPQPGDAVSVADLLGALSQPGSGQGGSVPAAAA